MSPSSAAPPVLTALRHATSASHVALEDWLRLDGDIAMDRYARVLAGFDRFLSPWEASVRSALPQRLRPWFSQRSRLPFLLQDLQHLGRPRAEPAPAHELPPLDDLASAFGSLYVIEGSALGGQVIARRLAERFGRGSAYFHGWGDRTGRHWREFRDLLEAEVGDDPARHQAAALAAVRTFDGLARSFRAVMHDHTQPA